VKQDGTLPEDKQIGRFIARALQRLPRFPSGELDKFLNGNLQDLLLVVYLANLTQTQLDAAESLLTI
jgi:translation initiation factor 3 subunit F